jgi:hypothetical protein
MAGSGPLEPVTVILRAVEGVGLLVLGVVFIAAGSVMKRKASPTAHTKNHASRTHHRTV